MGDRECIVHVPRPVENAPIITDERLADYSLLYILLRLVLYFYLKLEVIAAENKSKKHRNETGNE